MQNAHYGRTDVCGDPDGHSGHHHGVYHHMVWETYTDQHGRRKRNIIDQGEHHRGDRRVAGRPVHYPEDLGRPARPPAPEYQARHSRGDHQADEYEGRHRGGAHRR